jgi:phosphomannomutase
MRHRLLTSQAVLGLDACGHYFLREAGSRDDGLYSALFVVNLLGRECSFSAMRQSAGPLFSTPELRIRGTVLDYATVVARLRRAFPDAEELAIDGARLTVDGGIVLVRESSTEPVVSLRIEGSTEHDFGRLLSQCLTNLGEAQGILRNQIRDSEGSAQE